MDLVHFMDMGQCTMVGVRCVHRLGDLLTGVVVEGVVVVDHLEGVAGEVLAPATRLEVVALVRLSVVGVGVGAGVVRGGSHHMLHHLHIQSLLQLRMQNCLKKRESPQVFYLKRQVKL